MKNLFALSCEVLTNLFMQIFCEVREKECTYLVDQICEKIVKEREKEKEKEKLIASSQ